MLECCIVMVGKSSFRFNFCRLSGFDFGGTTLSCGHDQSLHWPPLYSYGSRQILGLLHGFGSLRSFVTFARLLATPLYFWGALQQAAARSQIRLISGRTSGNSDGCRVHLALLSPYAGSEFEPCGTDTCRRVGDLGFDGLQPSPQVACRRPL